MYDTLIVNGTVITADDALGIIQNGAVAVGNGKILNVWLPETTDPLPEAEEVVDAQGGFVMPGLVNAHTHLPMALFRGLADDLPLAVWLNEHMFPAEANHITPETVVLGARLACAELLLGGTTTCCDGYFLVDHFADAVAQTGIRGILGHGVIDFPAPGVSDPALNVETASRFARKWRDRSGHLRPSIFCHSPYTCSSKTLIAAKQAADDLGVLFQVHVAETDTERNQSLRDHGLTPVAYLEKQGVLDENTLMVHCVWVDRDDIEAIHRTGARVAHCPESNMKLGAGIAPVPDMIAAGIPVGLGTDGCASNNDLDLWGEMDMAGKVHKVQRHDPTVMNAETVLRMATINGARALGMDRLVGSLAPGKLADIIVLRSDQPHLTPVFHPASHVVYSAGPADVRHVMVGGRWVVRNGRLLTVDLEDLLPQVDAFARRLKR